MKIIPVGQAKAPVEQYVDDCTTEGHVVFTRNGKAVAILRPPTDDEELYRLRLAYFPRFQAMMERSRREIREGRGLSHEEFWKRVEEDTAKRDRAKKKKPKKQPA